MLLFTTSQCRNYNLWSNIIIYFLIKCDTGSKLTCYISLLNNTYFLCFPWGRGHTGPGLAFIAFPRAVAMMPIPQLWAVCFFIMIIMLGLDTQVHTNPTFHSSTVASYKNSFSHHVAQFVSLEALMTSATDLYPHLIRRGHRRELLLLFVCIVCFLMGLVMVTPVSRWHARGAHERLLFVASFWHGIMKTVFLCLWPPNADAGWSVCVSDLWPFLLQRSQPAASLHLPVRGHRLVLRYTSLFTSLFSFSFVVSFSSSPLIISCFIIRSDLVFLPKYPPLETVPEPDSQPFESCGVSDIHVHLRKFEYYDFSSVI